MRKPENDGANKSPKNEGRKPKNMKKTPNQIMQTRVTRFLVIFTSVLLLLAVLASCGSKKATLSYTEAKDDFSYSEDGEGKQIAEWIGVKVNNEGKSGGKMKADQINATAKMLTTVFDDQNYDIRDYLIAASRGYDMLADGFNDAEYEKYAVEDKAAAAVKVIGAANAKAAEGNKINESVYSTMNEADLEALIATFKTTVVVESNDGFFDKIFLGIGKALSWMTRYLGGSSYIIGICEFAILIEILMIPFAILQQKNTIKQAKLRPKEMAIRNKYAGRTDQKTQQQVQREIQELYQRENFSPFSGCLPLLLQMPILIILYRIVIDPLHYVLGLSSGISGALGTYYTAARAAGGLGFATAPSSSIGIISSISRGDLAGLNGFQYFSNGSDVFNKLDGVWENLPNFNIGKFNFGLTPSFRENFILLLVPVLTFVVYFFSMKLNRKFGYQPGQGTSGQPADRQTACSNTMMDISMPALSTFFTFVVPAIIGVYWIFRSILGVLKQFIMSKVMPLPKFTEDDYKAAARELAGKKQQVVKSERAGRVRSLHHIDDEDYDDTREAALARKAAMEEEERKKQESAGKTPVESAPLKEDRPEKKTKKNADSTDKDE